MMDDIQKQNQAQLQADLQEQIETMIALVDDAARGVSGGKIFDLSSLEGDVSALCRRVERCDPVVARGVQPFMGDLISRLDGLAMDLQAFKKEREDG